MLRASKLASRVNAALTGSALCESCLSNLNRLFRATELASSQHAFTRMAPVPLPVLPLVFRGYAARPRPARRPVRPAAPETSVPALDEQQAYVEPSATAASSVELARVLNSSALAVTRNIEWGNVLLGFEQANQYAVLNENGETVARIAEDNTGIGSMVGRQLLRTRRSFTATVFNAEGTQILFKLRRPMYLISSTMYVEDGAGNEIGEIQGEWHPLYRKYNLFIDKKQFAAIQGAFLTWEFELRDNSGGLLALVDRNFSGFMREIFTDAGKYVIHFGKAPQEAAQEAYRVSHAVAAAQKAAPPTTVPAPVAAPGTDVVVSSTGNQLAVARPLGLDERMTALACAITVDFDYFSQHSHSSGMLLPVPIPIPSGGGAPGVEGGLPPVDAGAAGAHEAASNDNTQSWMDTEEADDGDDGGDGGGWWDLGRQAGELFGVLPSDD